MNAIVCSFSGDVTDVKKSKFETWEDFDQRRFAVFAKSPRVSVWDMSDGFYPVINSWTAEGLIEEVEAPFPWLRYRLTGKGFDKLGISSQPHEDARPTNAAPSQLNEKEG